MTRIVVTIALCLAVVAAALPSWPVVAALCAVVALAVALAVLDHFAARDGRLDLEARVAAKRSALVIDELVNRIKVLEDFASVQRAQRVGPNGGPPANFLHAMRGG